MKMEDEEKWWLLLEHHQTFPYTGTTFHVKNDFYKIFHRDLTVVSLGSKRLREP